MDMSAMPKAFSGQQSWYLATLSSLSSSLVAKTNATMASSKLLYSYNHVIHGFSASLTPAELEALKKASGYVSSIKDRTIKADTTHSYKFFGLNYDSGAWPVSDFGKDVIIGVIDTGVWPESESFNDGGMSDVPSRWKGECESGTQFNSSLCNKKLIGARYFNKAVARNGPTLSLNISMNSARDTDGHGTHTSTIAAGNYVKDASYFGYAMGTARGMAPGARVAIYKAFWNEGRANSIGASSDIMAAIDKAITDGCDVLSMSFGFDEVELYEDPIAIATFAAIEKNIFVSTSAGNEGDLELLHNGTPWVLTVAAGTMDRKVGATMSFGSNSVDGMALYPRNFSSTRLPIVFMDSCNSSVELRKVVDKIVVCQDPGDREDSLNDQFNNVRFEGNVAGVFITKESEVDVYTQLFPIPSVFLGQKDGDIIVKYIKSNNDPKARIEFNKTFLGIKPSPKVTSYTSRGPSYSCPSVLKPDVMAPGDLVLAAWPSNVDVTGVNEGLNSNFKLLSGTSMACAHVSGIAALVKAAHPDWSPAAIRSALMTTAYVVDNTGKPIKDAGRELRPADPLAMGAGHVNPNKALDPGLIYDATVQDYLNLLCALNFTEAQIKTITKSSSIDCSNPSLDLNYPSFIAVFRDFNAIGKPNLTTVREFTRTVTNVAEGSFTYKATVTPMKGLKVTVEPNVLVFKGKNDKKSFKLSIKGPRQLDEDSFGYQTWEDSGRKHVVRSPVVATSYIIEK
ncbi:hypothetical protein COLO4_26537 [Corchorus olitorius]|uniref:Peptidase S8/S53 domain-containing protein n=1 Tax=Corchorus olitorius TaxID=93759 RepID=A0A1R3HWR0_9ROSI|nr:hypothetical protein COLO4_26537 [Corchorus olitorius]